MQVGVGTIRHSPLVHLLPRGLLTKAACRQARARPRGHVAKSVCIHAHKLAPPPGSKGECRWWRCLPTSENTVLQGMILEAGCHRARTKVQDGNGLVTNGFAIMMPSVIITVTTALSLLVAQTRKGQEGHYLSSLYPFVNNADLYLYVSALTPMHNS
eukprot:g9785.t1